MVARQALQVVDLQKSKDLQNALRTRGSGVRRAAPQAPRRTSPRSGDCHWFDSDSDRHIKHGLYRAHGLHLLRSEWIVGAFEPANLVIEEAQDLGHAAEQEDVVSYLFDADVLTGDHLAEIDLQRLKQVRPQRVTVTVRSWNGYSMASRPR
jgi:hypothetical protein